ncbi:MAG: hypothetical protein ACHP8A_17365 [Terriglobales bacterium]
MKARMIVAVNCIGVRQLTDPVSRLAIPDYLGFCVFYPPVSAWPIIRDVLKPFICLFFESADDPASGKKSAESENVLPEGPERVVTRDNE